MDNALRQEIRTWIVNGVEGRKIEFKREFDLSDKVGKAKFAKLITAIANASGGTGYFIIGVNDARDRTGNSLDEIVAGVSHDADIYQRQVQQALSDFAYPVPEVTYVEIPFEEINKRIGVVIVKRSRNKPHEIIRDGESVKVGTYIRRGSETYVASAAEMRVIFGSTPNHAVIVNFAHPITEEQCEQIAQNTGLYISEVVQPHIPVHFDEANSFSEQVRRLVDSVPLTQEEWQGIPILVNVPGFATITATLLAELHGRMGHFPKVIRFKRSQDGVNGFEFGEILQLQDIRTVARERHRTGLAL